MLIRDKIVTHIYKEFKVEKRKKKKERRGVEVCAY